MTLNFYQYFQLLCLLIAIGNYRYLSAMGIRAFIPLLFITNVLEMLGINYKRLGWESNYFIYNLYLVITTPFFLYLFSRMLGPGDKERRIFLVASVLIMLFLLLNFFFGQGMATFNTYSLIVVELTNIILASLILIRLALQSDLEVNLVKEPFFWINAATLLFSLVTLVLLGFQQYIRLNKIKLHDKSLYYAIMPAANVVLYLVYAYAFVLCRMRMSKPS